MGKTTLGELYLALTCFWASGKTQAARAKAWAATFPSQLGTEFGAEEASDRVQERLHRFRDRFAGMTPEANIARIQSECELFRAALSTARREASPANLAALTKAAENALAASMAGYGNAPQTAELRNEIIAALPALIEVTHSAEAAPVNVVILTAVQVETEAVLRDLTDRHHERVADTWFHTGKSGQWTVAIAEVGPGNTRAATVAMRAFNHFRPEIAAFIGVAGGVKDVALGDVVVGTKIYSYESGKDTADGFLVRPDIQNSDHELEQRARVLRTSSIWHNRLDAPLWTDRKPSIHVGPIAAGEAVVASRKSRIAAHLKTYYGDALAVEMEGRGFLEAAHIEPTCRAVVIRGISDRLTGKAQADKLGWQRRAADAAAAFFFEMLVFRPNHMIQRSGSVGWVEHRETHRNDRRDGFRFRSTHPTSLSR